MRLPAAFALGMFIMALCSWIFLMVTKDWYMFRAFGLFAIAFGLSSIACAIDLKKMT